MEIHALHIAIVNVSSENAASNARRMMNVKQVKFATRRVGFASAVHKSVVIKKAVILGFASVKEVSVRKGKSVVGD